jgi:hypothetical protein
MKHSNFIRLLLFATILASCGLLDSHKDKVEVQYATGKLNDVDWTAEVRGVYREQGDSLLVLISADKSHPDQWPYWEDLFLSILVLNGHTSYELQNPSGDDVFYTSRGFYSEMDDDVIIASYQLEPSLMHTASITLANLDKNRKIAEGSFNATFNVLNDYRDRPDRLQEDTLRFRNGRYRVVLEAY